MGLFDSIGKYIEPIASIGSGLFNAYNHNRTSGDYSGALRAREDANYANYSRDYDAYLAYKQQADAARAANAGIAAQNANAAAAAAAATEKNRQAAAKKGLKKDKAVAAERIAMFEPYRQTGLNLLPQMEKTYSGGLGTVNMLNAYLNTPGQLQKLNQAVRPSETGIKLPDYLRGG